MSLQEPHHKIDGVIGPPATVQVLLREDFTFVHAAGVYLHDKHELYITSNRLTAEDNDQSVQLS